MNLTWHIFRKDFVRFRLVLLAWVLFMAVKYLAIAQISGVFGSPSSEWLNRLRPGFPLFFIITAVSPLAVFFLVGALVFEDAPGGRDPFWVTRPISGAKLLAAKLLGAVVLFVLPPVLMALPWWLACGFGWPELAPFVASTGGFYLLIALVGLAGASVTDGYPRYVVWTLVGLGFVFGAHVASTYFRDFSVPMAPFPFYAAALIASVAVLALEITCHRYLARRRHVRLGVVTGLTLLGGMWLFRAAPAPIGYLLTAETPVFAGEGNLHAAVGAEVGKFREGGLLVPLRVEGLPENVVPITTRMQATWRAPDGKLWTTKGGTGDYRATWRRVARQILHLPPDASAPSNDTISFFLPAKNSNRIATEATTVEGVANFFLTQATLRAETPIRAQVTRFAGGSFTVSDCTEQAGSLSFVFTARIPPNTDWQFGLGYIALVNRRTGEVIEASQVLTSGAPPLPFLKQVYVYCAWMRFKIPGHAWLDESKLALIGVGPGHWVDRTVPAYTRTGTPAVEVIPPPVKVPVEILRQYAGVYCPRPGAKLVVSEYRGNLVFTDSGFYKTVLVAQSNTLFNAPNQDWIFATGRGFQAEFMRDAQGAVTQFVVHQNGHDSVVPRLADAK